MLQALYFKCVQLAEYMGRMRLDRKMWLLMLNGAGVEKGEELNAGMGPEPHIKHRFNDLILIKIFLIIHSINIV